jgi:hypothetical protein
MTQSQNSTVLADQRLVPKYGTKSTIGRPQNLDGLGDEASSRSLRSILPSSAMTRGAPKR